jgi:hypothetical protein
VLRVTASSGCVSLDLSKRLVEKSVKRGGDSIAIGPFGGREKAKLDQSGHLSRAHLHSAAGYPIAPARSASSHPLSGGGASDLSPC